MFIYRLVLEISRNIDRKQQSGIKIDRLKTVKLNFRIVRRQYSSSPSVVQAYKSTQVVVLAISLDRNFVDFGRQMIGSAEPHYS